MGGIGSGSYYRYSSRDVVESYCALDVRWLHRNGYLCPGALGTVRWTRNGEPWGSITVKARDRWELVLLYRERERGKEWRQVEWSIRIDWTPCNYGGERPWFRCPNWSCSRRVAKLYGGERFYCRHCYGLAYQTQREPRDGRLLLKSQRIRERLGGSASLAEPVPDKPKGMHWRTYERLLRESDEAYLASWGAVRQRLRL